MRDRELKIKIMPHKENDTAAVFIEGFIDQNQAKRFCMAITKLDDFKFINFAGNENDR